MTIKEQIQENLDDYTLSSNNQIMVQIKYFGSGVAKFHTADVERLIQENEFYKNQYKKAMKAMAVSHLVINNKWTDEKFGFRVDIGTVYNKEEVLSMLEESITKLKENH